MITLNVNASKFYSIFVAKTDAEFPVKPFQGKKVCFVSDSNVAPLYLNKYARKLNESQVFSYVIPAGEGSKSAENFVKIQSFLAENEFTRGDILVALGGGVVGDLTGFVASTYMRGIAYHQIPTSLLAMIDSSVGGKTAIDLPQGKNLVGSFYQPSGVYVDLSMLMTLPKAEMDNGMGELVKYAFLDKEITKSDLRSGITDVLIAKCLSAKIAVVEADEKESGKRMLLNFGHTVGHALEALSGYALPHGACVAKGIASAIALSKKVYGLSNEKVTEMQNLLHFSGIDLSSPYKKEEILALIRRDKKAKHDGVDFVLIQDIGNCQIKRMEFSALENLL